MGFYEWFISKCVEKGVSVAEAAKSVGVSSASANGWKNGSKPKDTTIFRIEQYFGEKFDANEEDDDPILKYLLEDERILLQGYRTMDKEHKRLTLLFLKGAKSDRGN